MFLGSVANQILTKAERTFASSDTMFGATHFICSNVAPRSAMRMTDDVAKFGSRAAA